MPVRIRRSAREEDSLVRRLLIGGPLMPGLEIPPHSLPHRESQRMKYGLNIRQEGALDFVSLGALVHRLDPGIIPFRKAHELHIHVSGGEFNVSANLSDCFGLATG